MREELMDLLIRPNFLKVLVKNLQNQKNQLHDTALKVRDSLVAFITSSNLSGDYSLKLL